MVLLKPENGKNGKWKVVKYRNPEGGKAPITFLKVPLHIWEKVAARYGIAMPSYIEVTQEGSALGFWEWVLKNQVPVTRQKVRKKQDACSPVASVFKLPIVRIKNNFKGDTPPVTFLELPKGRHRIAKAEFEYLAKGIMGVDCPAIATDSLNDAEALYKMFTAQGKKGILLSSKTATKKWAKEFLANPDNYIRKHKPEFIIFTPTAESGLDISIKTKLDSVEVSGKYFSDVFCIFRGVIGVDECLQMSRRVRHPERIVICCAERKFASNNDSNPFSGQLIKDLEERVTAEALALSPEENTAAIKEAIKAQIDSPHLEAWARIKGKDAVEGRNLRRFLLKAFEDGGYEVNRISFSDLLNPDAIYDEGMSFADAKKLSKEEEAKQIFNSEFITLEKYLEIEGSNAEWEDCCKAIKYRLLAVGDRNHNHSRPQSRFFRDHIK